MAILEQLQQKILTSQTLEKTLSSWRTSNKTIVFTNGCFDLIHRGHIDYLTKAADLGDVLIIGLNTDNSVSRIKGSLRPIIDEYSRAMVLSSMFYVSAIILFDEDTPYNLITKIQPDVLVKGGDYKVEEIIGSDIVLAKGGRVETLEYLSGFSTSAIEQKIKGLN
jgi:rfaE bifunctional protein nucleotidyltransferase chain/domain